MRQGVGIELHANHRLMTRIEMVWIGGEAILLAAMIVVYTQTMQLNRMKYCDNCTFTVSNKDTSSYVLNGGEVFCITESGSFEGRILRWTGSSETQIYNEGKFLPKNIHLTAGINTIHNFGIFQPDLMQIFPGTLENIVRNHKDAIFQPKYLHLVSKNSELYKDDHKAEWNDLKREENSTYVNVDFSDNSFMVPRLTCWPSKKIQTFDFSCPLMWKNNLQRYILERSEDGNNFSIVMSDKVDPDRIEVIQKDLIDKEPLPGTSYYRLKLKYYHDQYLISDTLSVSYIPKEFFAMIPSYLTVPQTTLYIYAGLKLIGNIAIYNKKGEQVQTFDHQLTIGPNLILLDLTLLPKGEYWVGFESAHIDVYYPYAHFYKG